MLRIARGFFVFHGVLQYLVPKFLIRWIFQLWTSRHVIRGIFDSEERQ